MTLTNFVVFWLCSIAFSVVGRVVLTFSVLKDAGLSGYKYNRNFNIELNNSNHLELLVPGYNIMKVFYLLMASKSQSDLLISSGIAQGMFERMTIEEEESFKKNPSGINALLICIKGQMKEIEEEEKEDKKEIFEEEKFAYKDELVSLTKKLKSIKPNESCNIKIGELVINFTLIEQNGEKKIIYNNYNGDLSKLSDEDFNKLLLLGILDTKSTADYYIKLRNRRERLQKYIGLKKEVSKAQKNYEKSNLIDINEYGNLSGYCFGPEKKKTKTNE